jgi:RNA 2',3'-cyclic 3'-phosphodiesterase
MGRLKLRTFIALPIDDVIRKRVVALQEELGETGAEVKWVEPENLHVTLLFLGEIDALEVVDICRAVRKVAENTAPFSLSVSGIGAFPNMRRPRTLWIGVDEGRDPLVALHDALEGALLKLGAYRREERGYTPHLTLGRITGEDAPAPLKGRLTRESDWLAGTLAVREVHVMSSELLPDGPRYSIVSRERLRAEVE